MWDLIACGKCARVSTHFYVNIHNKPSRFNDETGCNGGVPLTERRLRSLSFRFLSFFFFFMTGVVGVSGDSGSTIGDCSAGDSNDIERDALWCFFFFDFFRLSLAELIELVDRWKFQFLFLFSVFCLHAKISTYRSGLRSFRFFHFFILYIRQIGSLQMVMAN